MPTAFTHDPNMGVPSSTTDTAVVRWSGTTGGTLLSSGVTIDNSNVMAGVTSLTVDNLNLNGNTISSTAGTDLFITPLGGQQLILDGLIVIDNGVVTGTTSITSTEFVGGGVGLTALNGTQVTSGTLPAARIGADSIVEGKLNVSNGPTNGQVLTARDGVAGGFTWEAAGGGAVSAVANGSNNRIATFSSSDALNGEANFTFDNWPIVKRSAGTGDTFVMEGFNDANYHTRLVIRKSQHDTIDTMTVVDSDQTVGEISFQGASGTSAGNWGVGAAIRVDTSDNAWSGNACPAMMRFYTCPDGGSEPVQRILIQSNGNVGIGNHTHNTASRTLHVREAAAVTGSGAAKARAVLVVEANEEASISLVTPSNRSAFFEFASNSSGGPGYIQYVHGSNFFVFAAGAENFRVYGNGNITNGLGSSTFHTGSDERIKENIVDSSYGLAEVMQLRSVKFNFADWHSPDNNPTRVGLIAQEVEEVLPELVGTNPQEISYTKYDDDVQDIVALHEPLSGLKSIDDQQMIPILVKAIQELKAEVDALKE